MVSDLAHRIRAYLAKPGSASLSPAQPGSGQFGSTQIEVSMDQGSGQEWTW